MESQKTKAKITYTKDLREWQLGKLEGQKLSIIQAIYPKEMDAFRHNLANFRANNFQAESVYHTTKRVADLVRTLKDGSMKNVLLVGHGANLTASIRSLLGFEPGLLRKAGGLDNASVTILEQMIVSTSLSNLGMTHPIGLKSTKLAKSSSYIVK